MYPFMGLYYESGMRQNNEYISYYVMALLAWECADVVAERMLYSRADVETRAIYKALLRSCKHDFF